MPSATFVLSAFGDEIAPDPKEQLSFLRSLKIGYLELRGAWSKNVLQFDDNETARVSRICKEHGIQVSCIGSPIGKTPIVAPIEQEIGNLDRAFKIADGVNTRSIRIFSFYPPDTTSNIRYDEYVAQATERLARLTRAAENEGFDLLLENEKEIVGDTPERCYTILRAVNSPRLRFTWDPANFVQVGVGNTTDRGWPTLGKYVAYVHVKDALLGSGAVKPAGEGDGQVKKLLSHLRDNGYRGFLSLEPHLAGGPESMAQAAAALRKLLAELDCSESEALGIA